MDLKGTERVYPADLVVIALNSGSVDIDKMNDVNIPLTPKGLIAAGINSYKAGIKGLYACGDCRMWVYTVAQTNHEQNSACFNSCTCNSNN